MPDIKHQFSSGKMNKDLDERVVPNGEYRDAMNIQVSTSEGSNVGTAQNIFGNKLHFNSTFSMPSNHRTVGVVGDEKNDYVYWFVHGTDKDCILRKSVNDDSIEAVFVDVFTSPFKRVLGFGDEGTASNSTSSYLKQITGINILDDLLFWTDNYGEPKKININRSVEGTAQNGNESTYLVNKDTGNVTSTRMEEKHVCVIKRGPSTPLRLDFNTTLGRDENKTYAGIVNVTDDFGTLANTSSLFVPDLEEDNYDFSEYVVGDIMYLAINTDIDGNPDFDLEWEIGTKIVLKEFDDDGIAPTTPLRDYRIKGKIVDFDDPITGLSGTSFSQDTSASSFGVSSASFPNWVIGRSVVAIEIESINGFPPAAIGGYGFGANLNYVIDVHDAGSKLFEFKFPRFSYRYKYEDGEYSIFAPWSEVAFLPSSFDNHPQKGYNLGMTNKIQDILIDGFVPLDIPLDVVEVDILYKEDTSTNIYVVETIGPKDNPTNPGALNVWEVGSYYLTSETIKSIVPSNQLLRAWDNVPRKALGQEVTGNRVVYANYLQQFNLRVGDPNDVNSAYWQPKFEISVQQNLNSIPSPIKTIKSLREYQLGVVFVDAYGRETPVLSNNTGSIKLDKSYATTGNQLSVSFSNLTGPSNMAYLKFYIKETSGEYYNMAMDRFYDASDGNVWLAFPSSDRNKIDIDTFLILKKGTGSDTVVNEPARYKVLAIENEAPDFVKTTRLLISTKTHTTTGSGAIDIFGGSMVGAPETGGYKFKVKYQPFYSDSGGDLHNLIKPGVELWVDFKLSAEDEVSARYRVTSIKCDYEIAGTVPMGDSYYYVTIDGLFNDDINFITDDPTGANSTKILETTQIRFWKYAVENRPQFDGRFFVKIFNDGTFKQYVTKDYDDASANDYRILSKKEIYLLDESMHSPDFAGGSIQIWNAVQDLGKTQSPHYATGIPTYMGIGNSQYFTQIGNGEYNTFEEYYGTGLSAASVLAGGAMDISRNSGTGTDGWWRKTQFWAWFVDYHWQTGAILDNDNLHTIYSSIQGADLDTGGSSNNFIGHNSGNYAWTAAGTVTSTGLKKPDKKHETWFIDNGRFRGRHKLENKVGDLTASPSNYGVQGNHASGGYTAGGIENYHGDGLSKMNLSFGPIWSEDPATNDEHFNISEGSPNYPHQADFVSRMKPGAQFRWKEDPTQTVYTIGPDVREWNIARYSHPHGGAYGCNDGVDRNCSSENYPANFNKYYYLHVTPKMGDGWDPTKNPLGPIDGGHSITLPISAIPASGGSVISTSGGPDDCWILMDSIVGVDAANGGIEAQLRQGLIVESFVNGSTTISLPTTPQTIGSGSGAHVCGQYLMIDEIEYLPSVAKYKVYLVGYKWPLKNEDIPGNINGWDTTTGFEAAKNVTFRQASMNMVSPTYCDNWEKMQSQQVTYNYGNSVGSAHVRNTMGAVGYTLEWIERVDREEVMPDFPAVWETEPKEQPELDIYYEIGGLQPLKVTSADIGRVGSTAVQTAIPLGSTITSTHVDLPNPMVVIDVILDPMGSAGSVSPSLPGHWVILDGLTSNANVSGNSSGEYVGAFPLIDLTIDKPDGTSYYPVPVEYIIDANYLQPGTYPVNQNHALMIFDQSLSFRSLPSRRVRWKLPYFNAYSFGNGVESNRIRDNFNLPYILNGVKASTTLAEQYKEERRETGLIYSGIYNSVTGVNNLNQFIQAEKITKDLNPTYGSIQKLFSRDTDLITFCEDKVLKVLANKDAVYNADGNPQLIATPNVLGQTIPFSGDYGISKNPESFASESYRAYFTDKQRGAVLRLSQDGLTPISDYGMKDWFKDVLNLKAGDSLKDYGISVPQSDNDLNILGTYDTRNNEYNLKFGFTAEVPAQTKGGQAPGSNASTSLQKKEVLVSFKEENKGWISFKSFAEMTNGLSVSDKYFTFKDGKPYLHSVSDEPRNTFYGDFANSSITVLLNDDPGTVKTFNTLNYEGSQTKVDQFVEYVDSLGFTHTDRDYYNLADIEGWWVTDIHTDMQNGGVPEFINKENKWFNYITGSEHKEHLHDKRHLDESEFSFQGLGTVASFSVAAIIPGCMDPLYVQYNPLATVDDGSCTVLAVPGCMNASATNYYAAANVDDGSCLIVGCMWPLAFNYAPPPVNVPCVDSYGTTNGATMDANGNWDCCEPVVTGCMTANVVNTIASSPDVYGNCAPPDNNIVGDPNWPSALSMGACYVATGGPYFGYDVFNFDPLANTPGNCVPLPSGCTDSTASNYDPFALIDSGCLYEGCTDPVAANYNPIWTVDDGSCCYISGCTDTTASNYDPLACFDDGSCIPCIYGCMDILNANYDPLATCHDCDNYCAGNCGCMDPNAFNYDSAATAWGYDSCVYFGCLDPAAENTLEINGNPISCLDMTTGYNATPANYNAGITMPCGPFPLNSIWTIMPGISGLIGDGDPSSPGFPQQIMFDTCIYNIPGCTDVTAFNYNASATTDDGSCYPVISGCMDPTAVNFVSITGDPQVDINTSDPSMCCFVSGCTDPTSLVNYNPLACWDDGSCVLPTYGCMDSTSGYWNTGGSQYPGYNNMGSQTSPQYLSLNLCDDPSFSTDQFGIEQYVVGTGCLDTVQPFGPVGFAAMNYNPEANVDDGSCTYMEGCTDSSSYNYNPVSYYPVGSTGGCMNSIATNYDAAATVDDGSCCYPPIEGCLYENYTNALGEDFENYNHGSGSLGNPYDVQGWSQYQVAPTGNLAFDVNTHDQTMCIPKDGCDVNFDTSCTTTTYTTNSNTASNLHSHRNGAGCADIVGNDSHIVDYWHTYNGTAAAAGTGVGPFNFANTNIRTFTMNQYHGSMIVPVTNHPFNYNENWTEYATLSQAQGGSGTWPIETVFNTNIDENAYFQWDPAIQNSCCRVSGCLHPYALNFDAVGYKRNPNSPMDPIYVGVGVQKRVNGVMHIMEKADKNSPGGPNNPYDQVGPALSSGIDYTQGGQACQTCAGDPTPDSFNNWEVIGDAGERFQKYFNNGWDEDGNYTGDFSPKNRCGNSLGGGPGSNDELATMGDETPNPGNNPPGSMGGWHAQQDGCMEWRIDDPVWSDCCVFPDTYASTGSVCYNNYPNYYPGNVSYNYFNAPNLNNGISSCNYALTGQPLPTGHTDVMVGGCTDPNACAVPFWINDDISLGQNPMAAIYKGYDDGAMWDDGSCCPKMSNNTNGSMPSCMQCRGLSGATKGGGTKGA